MQHQWESFIRTDIMDGWQIYVALLGVLIIVAAVAFISKHRKGLAEIAAVAVVVRLVRNAQRETGRR
jgi:hypothetical protein